MSRVIVSGAAAALALLTACSEPAPPPPAPAEAAPAAEPGATGPYAERSRWLCGPEAEPDLCLTTDLSVTSIRPDGSTEVIEHIAAADAPIDCFYVYPTVNFEKKCGNVEEFEDIASEEYATIHQAARFSSVCRVIVPLYRQAVTCARNDRDGVVARDAIADVAYEDVRAAFEHHQRRHGRGRPYVLLGHSQGADLLARLVQEEIANSPELRKNMAAALLIGGDIYVPEGEVDGGTLGNVPLCRSEEETGCVIAYRSFAADYPPVVNPKARRPDGDVACTNPTALRGGKGRLSAAYFPNPSEWRHPILDVRFIVARPLPEASTRHLVFEDFWTAECKKGPDGASYLAIDAEPLAGDTREDWIKYEGLVLQPAALGTHILDLQFAQGDLIRLVETKAARMDGGGDGG